MEFWLFDLVRIPLQLLFFMFCLCILGEPWRIVIRRFTGLFQSIDILQLVIVNVFLGGLFLYTIAIVPLHLFTATNLYLTSIACGIALVYYYRGKLGAVRNMHPRLKSSLLNRHSLEIVTVASLFLLCLFVYTSPFNHLLFGSIRDTSLHSNFTELLLENRQIPETEYPYSSAGIIYPQAHSAILAYSVFIWNYFPPEAVFFITGLFNALTILGVYHLGKTLSSNRYLGLSLAFVFAFVASWPKYITWGSNALVMAFPFYFVCLSFIVCLARNKLRTSTVITVGVLIGYLGVLHLQVYESLLVALVLLWLYFAFRGEKTRWSGLRNVVVTTVFSLIVLSPFLYRGLAYYGYPHRNIGLPSDVEIPTIQPALHFVSDGIIFFYDHLAASSSLQMLSLLLIIASTAAIIIARRSNTTSRNGDLIKIGVATFLGMSLLFALAAIFGTDYTSPLLLSAPIFFPNQILLYIPFYLLIAVLNFYLYRFLKDLVCKIVQRAPRIQIERRGYLVSAISLMLIVGAYSPLMYQSVVLDSQYLFGSYAVFSITTAQDLQMILWMRDNLDANATILINTFSGGTFIPSVAHRKVVFLPHALSYSTSYQKLVSLLEQNVLSADSYELMKYFNITHVYVGMTVSPWENYIHKWDPKLFLGNPNFALVRRFGDVCLFQLNVTDPHRAFFDDFENGAWDAFAWQTYEAGHGQGNVTLASGREGNPKRILEITAKAVGTTWESKYVRYVSREFPTQSNSDITLSFYLDATEGFHGKDTFAILISDVSQNNSMILTTPNGFYRDYANAITLGGSEGFFEFKDKSSLSRVWYEHFGLPLPSPFVLQFVSLDFDGIENVAYVGNIEITSTPI